MNKETINVGNITFSQLSKSLKNASEKEYPEVKSFYLIMGSKLFKIYDLLIKKENRQIDSKMADLKIKAIVDNAFLYKKWDYLKYNEAELRNHYLNKEYNECWNI